MAVHNTLKRREEMLNAIKTIATMSLQDMVTVAGDLALENKKLREDYLRLQEDKAENEAMYEKKIKDMDEAFAKLQQSKLAVTEYDAQNYIRNKLGGAARDV